MKKLIMFAILTSAIKFLTGCSNIFLNYGYNVSDGKVLYKNAFPGGTKEIEDADAKTFKILFQPGDEKNNSNSDFAVDKNHAFYGGWSIPGSDGKTFTLIDRFFSKDKGQCYFRGKLIPEADPASFTVRDQEFSTDKNNVYKGTVIMDRTSSLFESFDSSTVIHTVNAVSVFDVIIPLLPGVKFKFLAYNYYAIDGQVYFQDKPMPDADITSFKAYDNFFSATADHVYYSDKIIENANPKTYAILPSPYGKDDKHVFFFEKTVDSADPKTFKILNLSFQCGRDKNWAYHEDKKIKTVSADDMANNKNCIQCNEDAIYFAEQ